jgi:hypothetical protein
MPSITQSLTPGKLATCDALTEASHLPIYLTALPIPDRISKIKFTIWKMRDPGLHGSRHVIDR